MFVNNAITGSSELTDKSNPKFISIEELTKFGPKISVIKFNQDLVIEPPNNTKINNIDILCSTKTTTIYPNMTEENYWTLVLYTHLSEYHML